MDDANMIVKSRKQLALVLFSLLWLPGVLPGQAVAASEFDTGLQLVERRSFRSALEYLNRALAESSLDTGQKAKMLLARGLSYKALLADTNAVMDFQEVLALDATSAEACYQLGMMYRSGRGVAKDSEKVLELMTRAANKDHIHAQRALAEHYFRKDHHDLSKSHFWLMKAANRGDSQAQLLLATRYAKGRGLIQNSKEAFKWYLRSAEEGEPVAQFEVAKSYRNGEPVEQRTAH